MPLPDAVVHSQLTIDVICTLPMLFKKLLGFVEHTELRRKYHRAVFGEHTNLNILDLDGNQTRNSMYNNMLRRVLKMQDQDENKYPQQVFL